MVEVWSAALLRGGGGAGETGKAAGSNSVIMLCVSDAGTWRKRGQVEMAGKLSE